MANEKRLIDANALIATLEKNAAEDETPYFHLDEITQEIFDAPTVDAVELPKGKQGDCILWDTGVGVRLMEIKAIAIYRDRMRYVLDDLCPVVNHPNILKIMSREEAEKWLQMGGDWNG